MPWIEVKDEPLLNLEGKHMCHLPYYALNDSSYGVGSIWRCQECGVCWTVMRGRNQNTFYYYLVPM